MRAIESRSHRTFAAAQRGGDLVVRQVLEILQQDRDAQLRFHSCNDFPHRQFDFVLNVSIFDGLSAIGHRMITRIAEWQEPAKQAFAIQTRICNQSVQQVENSDRFWNCEMVVINLRKTS